MDQKLRDKLSKRFADGSHRSLNDYSGQVDFISNDYLSLSSFKFPNDDYQGATGSRLISGNRKRIEEIESQLAEHFNFSNALCFNSGYDANIGIFSAIPQKGDLVLYDEHIHASVRDGIRLSLADSISFNHNSIQDLERLLIRYTDKTIYIAIEALYSMHGDIAPLREIDELAIKYKARIILDEAHSAGIIGPNGKGLTEEAGVQVYIKLVTFGKAFGGHGACVLSDSETVDYLKNFARSFIYTTALPHDSYERMLQTATYDSKVERDKLNENINLFRQLVNGLEMISSPISPIQIIRGEIDELGVLTRRLADCKIAVKLILPPTVKMGEECLRICLHSHNTEQEIRVLANLLSI